MCPNMNFGIAVDIAKTYDEDKIYDQAAIAKAAQTCLQMKGIHASFVIGKISNREIKVLNLFI